MEYPIIDIQAAGRRIRQLRISNHYSVEDVSGYMGFESVQAVYKWQHGESLPTVDNLYALSKLFGTTIEYILEGEEAGDEQSSSSHLYRESFLETFFNYGFNDFLICGLYIYSRKLIYKEG